jgi:uncharacterized protein (TIGR02246 family)
MSIAARRVLFIVVTLLFGAPLAQAQSVVPSDADVRSAIQRASRDFSAAYERNDTAAIAELYTEDALVLPPGREIRGRAAAAKYFQWGPRYRQVAHAMDSAELTLRGDIAIDVGTWTSTGQRGDEVPSTASGKYLVVWVREADGRWRMRYDMWHRPADAPRPEPRKN